MHIHRGGTKTSYCMALAFGLVSFEQSARNVKQGETTFLFYVFAWGTLLILSGDETGVGNRGLDKGEVGDRVSREAPGGWNGRGYRRRGKRPGDGRMGGATAMGCGHRVWVGSDPWGPARLLAI